MQLGGFWRQYEEKLMVAFCFKWCPAPFLEGREYFRTGLYLSMWHLA